MLDGTESPEVTVDLVLFVLLGDGSEDGSGVGARDGRVSNGLGLGSDALEGGSLRIADLFLLGRAVTTGEEDELFLVAVKSIHVHLELMFAGVGTAMVNRNTDSLCEPSAQLGGVQLLESETTSIANLTGVLPGSGRHDGSQLLNWTGESGSGLGLAKLMSLLLASRLVKVGMDKSTLLPVFP